MNKNSSLISKISNTLLSIFCTFMLFYIWSISTTKNIVSSMIVSITITLTIHGIAIYILYQKHKSTKLKSISASKVTYLKTQLLYGSQLNILEYYSHIFPKHTAISNILIGSDSCIALLYHKEVIDLADILPIYKMYSPIPIIVLCIDYSSDIANTISKYSLDIRLYNLNDTIIKYYTKSTPDFHIEPSTHKIDIKYIIDHILNKSRVKGYIFTSIFILLYTIYLPYKVLYISLSSILLILAILSLFINTKNT